MQSRFRRLLGLSGSITLALAAATSSPMALAPGGVISQRSAILPVVTDYEQLTASETPPTMAQCASANRRCFSPATTRAAYNLNPLYAAGFDGRGQTIAIVDAWGSDTIAHDLHVYNTVFGLPHMCGEEGVSCAPGMPTFSVIHPQGSPATTPNPGNGNFLEDRTIWALEVALDVETAHAIAPGANILLVATTSAETLGVQGFPQMMNAEQYVIDNHLANVISQSFGSAEEAFASSQSLENLRHAFRSAAANNVTVLASSGDGGTANGLKTPVRSGGDTIPFPTVIWPGSDPLVLSIGGTYLCTDPTNTTNRVTQSAGPPPNCQTFPGEAEIGWVGSGGGYSHVFSKPTYQNVLPAGSTGIGSMRGVPDVGLQASSRTGALVYITLPPDGLSGLRCGAVPCSTGWYDIGGTSLSCPEWAAMIAIADQINGGGLGLVNDALYRIGSNPARYAADFFDITTGNNQTDPSIPGYPATTGWDPITGLGTPNAANLLPDLVAAVHGH